MMIIETNSLHDLIDYLNMFLWRHWSKYNNNLFNWSLIIDNVYSNDVSLRIYNGNHYIDIIFDNNISHIYSKILDWFHGIDIDCKYTFNDLLDGNFIQDKQVSD